VQTFRKPRVYHSLPIGSASGARSLTKEKICGKIFIENRKGEQKMVDNPISWFILLCLAIAAGVWFAKKILNEIDERKRENDDWSDWGK